MGEEIRRREDWEKWRNGVKSKDYRETNSSV
jgi:hypothetical protein